MTIRRELIDELLKDYETPKEILGEWGLPEARETVYPQARVQLYMVHLMRNSLH
jgi:hypothetical protein